MAINYFAWLNIILLALKLLNNSDTDSGVTVKVFAQKPSNIHLSDTASNVYHVDLYEKKSGNKIKGYILIPRQDIFASNEADRVLSPFVPNAVFLTVNKFAIIFEEVLQEPDLPKSKTLLPYIDKVQRILNVDQNNIPIEHRDNYSTTEGFQVIQLQEYPQYVQLQIAQSGSASVDYEQIKKMFPHKMILLSIVPDTGKVHQIWLSGGDANFPSLFFKIQASATEKMIQFLSARLAGETNDAKSLKREIKTIMEKASSYDPVVYDFYSAFIDRIFLVEDAEPNFSGYQPKQTPDKITDFMPQIIEEVNQIPKAETENLSALYRLYKKYSKAVKKQHGKWVEGNLLLGGKAKEYKPSQAELLLCETGNRIVKIMENIDASNWVTIKKQQQLKSCKMKFVRFSFIHYDVMGSGRFFYVDKMVPVIVKWRKRKFEILKD